jgi:autotransporter-associated beta strand protein
VITVGDGETLVLDHPLCILGQDAYKRGKGTLVLRQGMCSPASRANDGNYFNIEEGIVVNEGCITNVIPVPGAIDRSDPANVPQFINRDGASMVGTTFVGAMHFRGSPPNPGNGLFTQEGGLVEPGINWSIRGIVGFGQTGSSTGGTGTYHLVNGTLRIPSGKSFNMHNNNGFGIFIQDGGLFEHNGSFDMGRGLVTLNGGTMQLSTVNNAQPIVFAGGFFRPLPASFAFVSGFELTGDGAFEIDSGKTMTLSAANPLRGAAPLNKIGEGVLTITGTGATMTGPVNVNAGTLRLTGCLPNSTNMIVAADATLEAATGTASFNAQTALRIETGGKLNLTGTGSVSVDALWLGGVPRMGHGRRYGSSSHAGAVDVVDDRFFVGTGVLVVTGRSLGDGTTIIVR